MKTFILRLILIVAGAIGTYTGWHRAAVIGTQLEAANDRILDLTSNLTHARENCNNAVVGWDNAVQQLKARPTVKLPPETVWVAGSYRIIGGHRLSEGD